MKTIFVWNKEEFFNGPSFKIGNTEYHPSDFVVVCEHRNGITEIKLR